MLRGIEVGGGAASQPLFFFLSSKRSKLLLFVAIMDSLQAPQNSIY